MFMQIAIGAIGIGVILMVGYIVISQVKSALPSTALIGVSNPCLGHYLNDTTNCNASSITCGSETCAGPIADNTSGTISVVNQGFVAGTAAVQVTVFAGFGLVAVGIIVLAAFGLINVFK